jgi:hypothetical protein
MNHCLFLPPSSQLLLCPTVSDESPPGSGPQCSPPLQWGQHWGRFTEHSLEVAQGDPDSLGLATTGSLLRGGDWDSAKLPAAGMLCPGTLRHRGLHSRRVRTLPLSTVYAHTTAPRADRPGAPARPAAIHSLRSEVQRGALPTETPLWRQMETEQAYPTPISHPHPSENRVDGKVSKDRSEGWKV